MSPPAGTRVSFAIDPAIDLAPVGGYRPTTANLFVAVYEPSLNAWIPLPSRYDPKTQTISAQAPHFSEFSVNVVVRDVTGPLKTLSDAALGYLDGVVEESRQIMSSDIDALQQLVTGPEQQQLACTPPNVKYTVDLHYSKFHGCLQETAGGGAQLEIQNTLDLPFGVQGPTGFHPESKLAGINSFADLIATGYFRLLGGSYLPSHGVALAGIDQTTLDGLPAPQYADGKVVFDAAGLALTVTLASLNAIAPEESKAEEVLFHDPGGALSILAEDGVTHQVTLPEVTVEHELESGGVPKPLEAAHHVSDAVNCALKVVQPIGKDGKTVLAGLLSAGNSCARQALSGSLSNELGKVSADALFNAVGGPATELGLAALTDVRDALSELLTAFEVGSGNATSSYTIRTGPLLGQVFTIPASSRGFGLVAPAVVNGDGDGFGAVTNIVWKNWGSETATGTGQGLIADLSKPLSDARRGTVNVVAFDLGSCDGVHPAYTRYERFPASERFDAKQAINICTGAPGG